MPWEDEDWPRWRDVLALVGLMALLVVYVVVVTHIVFPVTFAGWMLALAAGLAAFIVLTAEVLR